MEEEEHDFSSLNKYFKDEDLIDKTESVKVVKTIIEDISAAESSFRDYESEEETKIWSFSRYGLYERSYFKYPIPIGIILAEGFK